jgi:hypothetical protein
VNFVAGFRRLGISFNIIKNG